MDIYCPHNMSVSEDLSSFCALSLDPPELHSHGTTNLHVDDLGNCLTEFLNIQDKRKSTSTCTDIPSPDDGRMVNAAEEAEYKDFHEIELDKLTNEKCLTKCATFPCSAKSTCSADIFDVEEQFKGDPTPEDSAKSGHAQSAKNGHAQSADGPYPHSISLPTPLKLVSAMKGSREKQGAPPRKLTVTWAADVYDPIPTSVSHVPNIKPQRHRNDYKRNGKNKQKNGGKSSRGSKSKEKKQSRKGGGSSNRSFKPVDYEGSGACSSGPPASALDFDVGSPDPFCGHSFLKKSVTQLHFAVTEAT